MESQCLIESSNKNQCSWCNAPKKIGRNEKVTITKGTESKVLKYKKQNQCWEMDGHCQFNKRTNHTYDIFCYVFYTSDYTRFCNIIYGYMGLFDIYSKEDWRVIMAEEKK